MSHQRLLKKSLMRRLRELWLRRKEERKKEKKRLNLLMDKMRKLREKTERRKKSQTSRNLFPEMEVILINIDGHKL